jgi:hypothetical protein
MKLIRQLLFLIAGITAGFALGYPFGRNDRFVRDIGNSLPLHVEVYRSIRNNETNKASQLTVMGMWGKVLEWEVASKTMLFRLRSGNRLGANKAFQDKLREAQTIISQTRTNFVPLRAVSAGVDTPLTPLADFVKMTPFQAVVEDKLITPFPLEDHQSQRIPRADAGKTNFLVVLSLKVNDGRRVVVSESPASEEFIAIIRLLEKGRSYTFPAAAR